MILIPHIFAGAAIGSKINKPRWLFILIISALASHYLLDVIPHSEYQIDALMNGFNINFVIAAMKVTLDLSAGLIFIIFFCRKKQSFPYILTAALIAILPDAILFLSWQTTNSYLNYLAAFGHRIHDPENKSVPLFLGIATQMAMVALSIFIISIKSTAKMKKSDLVR